MSNMFEGFSSTKKIRFYQCITPKMDLWMGIQIINWTVKQPVHYRSLKFKIGPFYYHSYESQVDGKMRAKDIETFPDDVHPSCRCSSCRYMRIFRGK